MMRSIAFALVIVVLGIGLAGCAALPLGALGAGALSASANAAVQAGKEYTRSGAIYRTFSLPLPEVRLALSDALERMEVEVVRDDVDGDDRVIRAQARERRIGIRLEPVTRTVTRLRLEVAEGHFGKDRATATEIVEQTELSAARVPVKRAARGNGASSPARAGRR